MSHLRGDESSQRRNVRCYEIDIEDPKRAIYFSRTSVIHHSHIHQAVHDMCPMCAIKNILPVEGLGKCRRLSCQGTLNSSWRRMDFPIESLEPLYAEKMLESALGSVWGFHTSVSTKWSIYAVWPIGLLAKWVLFLNVMLNEVLFSCCIMFSLGNCPKNVTAAWI